MKISICVEAILRMNNSHHLKILMELRELIFNLNWKPTVSKVSNKQKTA